MAARDAEYEAQRDAQNAVLEQVMAKAPRGAKALIYAEYHEDTSDPMTDYHGSRTTRPLRSASGPAHVRTSARSAPLRPRSPRPRTWPAMRRSPPGSRRYELRVYRQLEHRDNYSMGAGNYLSDHDAANTVRAGLSGARDFPCKWVHLTEDAIPDAPAAPPAETEREHAPRAQRGTVISGDVLDILSRADAEGNAVRIADRLGPRRLRAVNEVLAAKGGKWNRKAQAHLFPGDAASILAALLADGSVVRPQDEGYVPDPGRRSWPTCSTWPTSSPGMTVLEPSAGDGAIAARRGPRLRRRLHRA